MRLLIRAALLALVAAPLYAGGFVPAATPAAGFGRYRVTLDTTRTVDPDSTITQLLSICRCRIEPYAEQGFTGFLIGATPSAARMLSSDPRVLSVEEIASDAPEIPAATPPAAPPASAPAEAPAMVAAAAPHIPVSNVSVVAWDTGQYTYDGSGNIRSIGADEKYAYDPYGRLVYARNDDRYQQYGYDRFGNLLTATTHAGTTTLRTETVDSSSNRLNTSGAGFDYDPAGRLRGTASGLAFRYDGDGMPTWSRMPIEGGLVRERIHVYSATDERIGSVWKLPAPASGSDWTIRDASGQVLRRLHQSPSGQWSWQEDYIYRDGQMLASEVATAERTLHYHLDHLGTPRLITGNGGAQVAFHTYDPFGAEVTFANQTGTEPLKKFTGHERDSADVDYMHARYYQNVWGRFLSIDPTWESADFGKPQTWNRYSYVRNNPINRIDPDGRMDGNGMGEPLEWICAGCTRAEQLEQSDRIAKKTAIATGASLLAIGAVYCGPSCWRAAGVGAWNWLKRNPDAPRQILDAFAMPPGPSVTAVFPGPAPSGWDKVDYVLGEVTSGPSAVSSLGKGKWFAGELGFTRETMANALVRHLKAHVGKAVVNSKGLYEMTGTMTGANGRVVTVKTVWEKIDDVTYQFVTAHAN